MFSKIKKIKKTNQVKINRQYRKIHTNIEIDSACVKALQTRLKNTGEIIVENIAVAELKYFSYNEVPKFLADFLKQNGFKIKKVVSCFPRNLSTIRFIKLPSTNPKELDEMASFQAIKQIPYNKEDMIVDYEVTNQENGFSSVMLAIAHKNVIFQHLNTLEQINITTTRIDINSQASLRTYLYFLDKTPRNKQSDPSGKTGATALVDIDYSHTNIQIIDGDNLLFTRGITLGILHLLLKEKKFQKDSANINWQSELMDELRLSLAVFSREHSDFFIEKIVLTGGISNFDNIERNVSSRFQVPVEKFDVTSKIEGFDKFKGKQQINGKEISLMAAIGLLLPGKDRILNMLPVKIKLQRKNMSRLAKFSVAASLIAGIMICAVVNFYFEIDRKSKFIASLEERINKSAPKVRELETMRNRVNTITQQLGSDRSSLDFLRELYQVMPDNIFLKIFLYDESKYIVIKGTANSMSEVFDLIPTLENSPFFEKVSSRGVKRRKVGKKEVVDFEIQCSIIKEEKEA